jgi:hypothetical protein
LLFSDCRFIAFLRFEVETENENFILLLLAAPLCLSGENNNKTFTAWIGAVA